MRGERGPRSFLGTPWAKNITVVRPKSIKQLDELFYALDRGEGGFKAVVLDSLTGVQKMTMRFLLAHSETAVRENGQGVAPPDQRTWGQAPDIITDITTFSSTLADADRTNTMNLLPTAQPQAPAYDIHHKP